jgi:hypothetical protein
MATQTSGFLGIKGLSGAVYRIDPSTNTPYLDDNGALVILDATGFYRIQINNLDDVTKTALIVVKPYPSKKRFIRNPEKSSYGGYSIQYAINNSDQVIDEVGNIITPGTYDTYFARTVVRGNNTSETDRARDLVNTFNGTNIFQQNFSIDFTGMTVDNITQNNINNALA